MRFKAAILHEIGQPLSIETVDAELRAPDDVLVRIRAAGLCHTDLEVIQGELGYPLPIVLGHQAAGIVEAVGPAVTTLAPGDLVILSWNPHCGRCYYCAHDQPILCETYLRHAPEAVMFDGSTRLSLKGRPLRHMFYLAAFAEYAIVSAQSAVKVSDRLPFECGCLIGCGVMTGVGAAMKIGRPGMGDTVVVIGCGAVGLSAVQGARLAGAGRVIAVDLAPEKLALAARLGATDQLQASERDVVRAIRGLTSGRGADVVIEAAGNDAAFRLSVESARPGGQVIWLGKVNVDREVHFRWGSLMGEKRIVRSSYGGARPQEDFPALSQMYLDGRLQLDPLISTRLTLDEINDGFEAMRRGTVVRAVVTM